MFFLFFLARTLSSIHKHSPTHRGHFIAAESGRSWGIDWPAEWDWGILERLRWWILIRWQTIKDSQRKEQRSGRQSNHTTLAHCVSVCVLASVRSKKMFRSTSLYITQLCHSAQNHYLKSYELVVARKWHSSEPIANQKICIQAENKKCHNRDRTSVCNDHLNFLSKKKRKILQEKYIYCFISCSDSASSKWLLLHNKPFCSIYQPSVFTPQMHVTCPIRGDKTLDHVYINIAEAYKAILLHYWGQSGHSWKV